MIKTRVDISGTLKSMELGDVVFFENTISLPSVKFAACKLGKSGMKYHVNKMKSNIRVKRYE